MPGSGSQVASPPGAIVALLGNPNTGKTTLFNRLTGLRHKTSNFPGTTIEARIGRATLHADAGAIDAIDLPGVYSLELDLLESEIARAVLAGRAAPRGQRVAEPSALCVVADATNLPRSLMLVGEALRRRLPSVVALNMIDLARVRGITIDTAALARELGCPVVPICARSGEGLPELRAALAVPAISNHTPPGSDIGLREWGEAIYARVASAPAGSAEDAESFTDRLDRTFTHPVLGIAIFAGLMAGLFYTLFTLARVPMDLIDSLFAWLAHTAKTAMPPGVLSDLLSDGVVSGIGATLVFLPQICLLFFLIAILEDTGYLARAAFVVDRLLRPFGLPGHAFVPLLSSHACALPGIMATRVIPDRRERLATILVAPFMSCSARLPVYALLTSVLFRDRPFLAALAFIGCYALGVVAAILSALVARRTILRGRARPMALELPIYKRPSLRTALLTTIDRGMVFLKKAGTNILAICIVLWWLSAYPHAAPPAEATALREQATRIERTDHAAAADLNSRADHLEEKTQSAHSFAGRLGRVIQPALAPIGADWQLSVGILTSFAAREVFVSTMAVVVAGEADFKGTSGAQRTGVLSELQHAQRDDGTPLFSRAACWALLVYYVLAMQCLPTLAVTARESGSWKWAMLQLVWMSGLAYALAAITYACLR
jgi:ferrous iron transport protein B